MFRSCPIKVLVRRTLIHKNSEETSKAMQMKVFFYAQQRSEKEISKDAIWVGHFTAV